MSGWDAFVESLMVVMTWLSIYGEELGKANKADITV